MRTMENDVMRMAVNDVIRNWPATVGVFAAHGIDACCGGALPVEEVVKRHGLDGAALAAALHAAAGADPAAG
jgi:iron-sulfur cluster repair protein YtfE (RIC family)